MMHLGPNSDLSISDTLLGEYKNISKNDLHAEPFDKVLNSMESSFCTFYTRPGDTLIPQNNYQKDSINDKHNSNFHCRRCNKSIEGKSIRCSDGKILGRFHRECFKCFEPVHYTFSTFFTILNRFRTAKFCSPLPKSMSLKVNRFVQNIITS